MSADSFDYASLFRPDLPPPAIRWSGFPKYNFSGGHNDADSVPVEDLTAAASNVLPSDPNNRTARDLCEKHDGDDDDHHDDGDDDDDRGED